MRSRRPLSRRRSGAYAWFLVCIVAGLAAALLEPGVASAYPEDRNNCSSHQLHWNFTNSSLWTDTKKTWVRGAINTLDNELDYDGTKEISVFEDGGIDVDIKDR